MHFAAFWSRCKILACDVRACAEIKKDGFISDTAVFYISLSLLPSSFAFLASFFAFAGYLVGYSLVGNVFRKAFRIDKMKGKVGDDGETRFSWKLSGQRYMVFWLFLRSLWLNRAHSERSLHPAQVSGQSSPWPVKLMMSQAVEGTWIRKGGYSLRGRRSKGKGKGILPRRLGQLTL